MNPPTPEPPAGRLCRAGTLAYTPEALARVFFWLLMGDVVLVLIDQIEPRILPILLKNHGATDAQIAFIVGSLLALINFAVTPVVSYRSDRKRSRWGRRIPYLFWATPFVSLFLALTPFAPEIAAWAQEHAWAARCLRSLPWAPVTALFAGLVLLYQIFEKVIGSIYFYLFRDVVPAAFLGRFLTLFRVVSAVAVFGMQYWLIGLADTHSHAIFVGIAACNLLGFGALCWFVREGRYPPVVDVVPAGRVAPRLDFLRAATNFCVESYRSPVYGWTYLTRLLIYAAAPATAFLLFFARDELHLSLDRTGKLMAWSNFAWLAVAYPIGRLLDRWGSIRVLQWALGLQTAAWGASFFVVVGERTFFASSLCTGSLLWTVLLCQLVLAQEIFHPQRMGQLSSANALVQSIVIAFVTSPLTGWLLGRLKDFHLRVAVPLAGAVTVGRYRFVFLVLAALSGAALFALYRVRSHWHRLGGPAHYQPPL